MVVMITVGPRMGALSALMASIFHASMQNAGIEALSISLSSALVGTYFAGTCDCGEAFSRRERWPGLPEESWRFVSAWPRGTAGLP